MANSLTTPTACIIVIGNEILSGQTEDTNLNYLARRLQELGILLQEARFVSDVENDIIKAIHDTRDNYTYIFTTGGIGPTHDDITASSIAKAVDKPLVCNLDAATLLRQHYPNNSLLKTRLKMSEMPQDCGLILNPLSAAPGFCVDNIYVLAGVPRIMQAMFEGVVPSLRHGPQRHVSMIFDHIAESIIATDLENIQNDFSDIEIGSYPHWMKQGDDGIRIVIKGYQLDKVMATQDRVMTMFQSHGGNPEIILI